MGRNASLAAPGFAPSCGSDFLGFGVVRWVEVICVLECCHPAASLIYLRRAALMDLTDVLMIDCRRLHGYTLELGRWDVRREQSSRDHVGDI